MVPDRQRRWHPRTAQRRPPPAQGLRRNRRPVRAAAWANPGTDSLVELRLRDGGIVFADQVHAGDQLGLDLNSAPVLIGVSLQLRARTASAPGIAGRGAGSGTSRPPRLSGTRCACRSHDRPRRRTDRERRVRVYGLSNDSGAGSCVAAAIDPGKGGVLWQTTLPAFSFAAPASRRSPRRARLRWHAAAARAGHGRGHG